MFLTSHASSRKLGLHKIIAAKIVISNVVIVKHDSSKVLNLKRIFIVRLTQKIPRIPSIKDIEILYYASFTHKELEVTLSPSNSFSLLFMC